MPSTGPVSGGGDQGADFETYKVGKAPARNHGFFSKSTTDKWLFACSLEKNYKRKIRSDLADAKNFVEPVQRLVFFHHLPIKASDTHKLKAEAAELYGLELEILDGKAIAELLVDRETVWIAQRYLSLPSELILAPESPSPDWFSSVLQRDYEPTLATSAEFFELKDAIRFATARPELHSDLQRLLMKIRNFRSHHFSGIRRKSIYEEFVASLRGLDTTTGLEEALREYLTDVDKLIDIGELEDAAVLIGYALGAIRHGVLEFSLEDLRVKHQQLTRHVAELESEAVSPARKCSLLFVLGYLSTSAWMIASLESESERPQELRKALGQAVEAWRRLVRVARSTPIFPMERLSRLVNEFIVLIDDIKGVRELIRGIDTVSAEQSGKQKVSEHHRQRAYAFAENEQYLRAVDELHQAHVASFSSGATSESVQICLQLAKLYAQMQLFFAAKYYALAATFAALKLPEERLRQFAYVGCAEAASADHATGGSVIFYLTARLFRYISLEYSMGGSEELRSREMARIEFYACLLARGAGLVFDRLQKLIVEQILPSIGLDEIYSETKAGLDEFFSGIDSAGKLAEKASSEGISSPFSDIGGTRRVSWSQLGIDWHLHWETSYEVDRQAQALAAYLQILLAEFATTEVSILPGEVFVTIKVHEKDLEIEEVPDNEKVRRVIWLPQTMPESLKGIPGYAYGVASALMKTVSALPEERFLEMYKDRFARGLMSRVTVYSGSESLFDEFYSQETYGLLYSVARSSIIHMPEFVTKTWQGLQGPQGTHPSYNHAESLRAVRQRYKNLMPLTGVTLPRLMRTEDFCQTLRVLRREGWKDWHILMAIEGTKFNYRLNTNPALRQALDNEQFDKIRAARYEPEDEAVLKVPLECFSEDEIRRNLRLSQLSTLQGLGLRVWQPTPNFGAIDQLLSRFHYWDDDVLHEEIFTPPA